jgi:hypothetical protein
VIPGLTALAPRGRQLEMQSFWLWR